MCTKTGDWQRITSSLQQGRKHSTFTPSKKRSLVLGDVLADDLGRRDAEEVPGLPWYGALDHEHPEVVVDLDDLELPDLGLGPTHPPGHLLPLVHAPRSRPGSDGTQLPVALGTVRHRPSLEVVPLDATCRSMSQVTRPRKDQEHCRVGD